MRHTINPTKILILAVIVLMAVATSGTADAGFTFREDGEGCPNGTQPPGWDTFIGSESGTILCTTSVKKIGTTSIAFSRDNVIEKDLPNTFVGDVSVSLWMFPTPDHNTNSVFYLRHTDGSQFTIQINESHTWFGTGNQFSAPYSGTWTFVEMAINTVSGTVDIWLDGVQVLSNGSVSLPNGINTLGVHSGRGGAGHTSYFDELVITSTAAQFVDIDIKPRSDPNSINCNNDKEVIAVAILTTDGFDATTVDHATVTFEGANETHVNKKTGEPRRHEDDVDGDNDTDLVLHVRLGDTDLTCDSTEGILEGETFGGQVIEGSDAVRMFGG